MVIDRLDFAGLTNAVRAWFIFAILILAPLAAQAYQLSGTVYLGGDPLAMTELTVYDNNNNALQSAVTDSNGLYALTLDSGSYHLIISPPYQLGLSDTLIEGVDVTNEDQLYHFVLLRPQVVLRGEVKSSDGSLVSGVELAIYNQSSGQNAGYVKTDASGAYSFPVAEGVYKIVAFGYGKNSNVPLPEYWRIEPAVSDLQLSRDQVNNIRLPNVKLSGKVTAPDGARVADVVVNINESWTNGGVSYHIHNASNTDKTDSNGQYELAVFDHASYDVELYPPLDSGYANRVVENNAVDGNTTVDFTVKKAIYLSGNLLTPSGLSVSGVELQIFDIDSYLYMGTTRTNANGEYRFPLRPGNYKIIAYGYGTNSNIRLPRRWSVAPLIDTISLSQDRVLDLELPVVKVSGMIADADGNPQDHVSLELISNWQTANVAYSVSFDQGYLASDELGVFDFYTLSYSDYSLTLIPQANQDTVTTQYTHLNLTQDTQRNFSLSGASKLSGVVTTPQGVTVSGVKLTVIDQQTNLQIDSLNTDNNGRFEFSLAPGLYKVVASGYAAESNVAMPQLWQINPILKDLNVNGLLETNIVLPLVTISGRIFDSSGNPVAGVQLEVKNATSGPGGEIYSVNNSRGFVTTDENGYYSEVLLAGDNYRFELTPPAGSDLLTEEVSGVNASESGHRDFTFTPTVILEGYVRDPKGRAVDGANLDFISRTYSKAINHVQTDGQGFYHVALREDAYDINIGESTSISHLPLPDQWHISPIVSNYRLTDNTTLNIDLPLADLHGKAIDSNGVPVSGVQVLINKLWKQGGVYYSVYAYGDKFKTNAQGDYAMTMPPYAYYSEQIIPPQNSGFVPAQIDAFKLLQDSRQDIVLSLPDIKAPLIVSGPVVTQITDSTAVVQWQTNEVTRGKVHYGMQSTVDLVADDNNFRRDHSVVLSSLTPATAYALTVSADDYNGNGPVASGQIQFQTKSLPDTQAPLILEGPSISAITSDSAIVRWTTSEPTLSTLRYGATIGGSPSQTDLTSEVSMGQVDINHEMVLQGLQAATAYTVQVNVIDLAGNGPTTSPLMPFYTLPVPDTSAPMIVAGPMVIDISESAATVVWETDEPASSGVSYDDSTVHGLVNDNALATYHSVVLRQLKADTVYNFTVSSTDASGNGPTLSAQDRFTTAAVGDDQPPVLLDGPTVINITHQSAVIRWTTDEQADSVIEYGILNDDLSQTEARSALVTNHNLPIVGLDANTTYYFRVLSHDSANNERVSDVYSFTTKATQNCQKSTITSAPEIIQLSDTSATVYWETDEATDSVVDYESEGKHWHKESSSHSQQHQITLTGLTPQTRYHVHVASKNSQCPGEYDSSGDIDVETRNHSDTQAPQLHDGVSTHVVDDHTVEICWNTDEIADAKVVYNIKGKALSKTAGVIAQSDSHKIVLTNLSYGETYSFKVYSRDIYGNQYESGVMEVNTQTGGSDNTSSNDGDQGSGAFGPLLLLQLLAYLFVYRRRRLYR